MISMDRGSEMPAFPEKGRKMMLEIHIERKALIKNSSFKEWLRHSDR
jgi:hypothetical protein